MHFVAMNFDELGCIVPNLYSNLHVGCENENIFESIERSNDNVSIMDPISSSVNGKNENRNQHYAALGTPSYSMHGNGANAPNQLAIT
jgi:hypothetical protein